MYGDWNLPEAERQFKTSIELTPNWVQAHRGYSICLRAMGRADEAVAADKEARELDLVRSRGPPHWDGLFITRTVTPKPSENSKRVLP